MAHARTERVVRAGAALYAAAVLVNTVGAPPGSVAGYLQWTLEFPAGAVTLWFAVLAGWVAVTRRDVPAAGAAVLGLGAVLVEAYLLYGRVGFLVTEYLSQPAGAPVPYGPLVSPLLWAQTVGAVLLLAGSLRPLLGSDNDGSLTGIVGA